jgi:U3 small nucleolar RNA-associated protein 7
MTHPIPHRPLSSIRFCPFQDILTVGHSAGLSSLLVPGAGEPNFDSAEADPFEGRNARRERGVRALLDKLAPDTIVLDPEVIGGVAESAQPGLGTEVVEAYRKLPRLERLRAGGKADESEVVDPLDAKVDEEESGGEGLNGLSEKEKREKREERKKRMRMRGKDKSIKRFLKKKRANVLDPATVRISLSRFLGCLLIYFQIAIRAKLEKQRAEQAKIDGAKAKGASATAENEGLRSALDRFRR